VFLKVSARDDFLIPFQKYFFKERKKRKRENENPKVLLSNGFLTIIVNQNARKSIGLRMQYLL
jgi:hypothetical protein